MQVAVKNSESKFYRPSGSLKIGQLFKFLRENPLLFLRSHAVYVVYDFTVQMQSTRRALF